MIRPSIEVRYAAAEAWRADVAGLETGAAIVTVAKLAALRTIEARRSPSAIIAAGTRGKYVRPWIGEDTVDWHVLEFYVAGDRDAYLAPAHLSHFRPA